jgi:ELWxxDGT repeat protein
MTIFAADDGAHGPELWRTDGTAAGTVLVSDINSGVTGSSPSNSDHNGNPLPFPVPSTRGYFSANDGVHGQQLWRSDGTAAGTIMITNVPGGADPTNILSSADGTAVYFLGLDASAVYGIYKYDGVSVTRITDSNINNSGLSGLNGMIVSGNNVYWYNESGLSDSGLYTSSGGAPTKLTNDQNTIGMIAVGGGVAYLLATGVSSNTVTRVSGSTTTAVSGAPVANNPVAVNGTLYYTNGTTLYNVNNTTLTTVKTGLDFNTDAPYFAALGSKLIFTSHDAAHGTELWVSDGTPGGTALLKDILPGSTSSTPKFLTTVGSLVFFQASDGAGGIDLWKTDGTTGGTVLVKHIETANLGQSGIQPAPDLQSMTAQSGVLLFGANDGVDGEQLWRSDGTAAGTFQLSVINPTVQLTASYDGPTGGSAVLLGGSILFAGDDLAHGNELWTTNGTSAGTALLKDISPGFVNSRPNNLTVIGSKVFFTASDGVHGTELWTTDGTTGNTQLVSDIDPGSANSNIFSLTAIGSKVFFDANDGTHGSEAWVSDGTPGGTFSLGDLNPGSAGSNANGFTQAGSNIFFTATTPAAGNELWVTDGTALGTHMVKDIHAGASDSNIDANSFRAFGSSLIFSADDGVNGQELWISDGTSGGTMLLKNINTTAGQGSFPNSLTLANGKLFFIANDGTNSEVWVSSGTTATTSALTSTSNFMPQNLTAVGNSVFFTGFTLAAGFELYTTTGGAPTLLDIAPGATGSNPANLTAVGSKLFFIAQDTTAHGTELWVSTDGTMAHTTMVLDINPAANQSSNPSNLTAAGGLLFFSADDGTDGPELWVSDGTAAGTHLVKDIRPGSQGSGISGMRSVGNKVTFTADDGVNGPELWISDGTAAGTVRLTNDVQPDNANLSNLTSVPLTINHAPSGTNKTISVPSNTIFFTFNALDFGFSDPGDAATFSGANTLAGVEITTLPSRGSVTDNGVAVTAGQVVSLADINAGKLRFVPAAPETGMVSFTFQVQDNGGTANGGSNTDPTPRKMSFKFPGGLGSDFNADGFSDVVLQDSTGKMSIIDLDNTSIVGAGSLVYNPGPQSHVAAKGDFNGDGKSDLVLRDSSTGQMAILLLDNTSIVGAGSLSYNPGLSTHVAGTGDFNGDGKSDLVLQDTSTGKMSILEMDSASIIGAGSLSYNPGPASHVVGTGDFNGDGLSDLVLQDDTGKIAILELNGTSIVGAGSLTYNPGPNVQVVGTGDFNGDGKTDLVLQNTTSGQMAILELDGTSIVGAGSLSYNPGPQSHVVDTGDYNGDGLSDLALRDSNTGQMAILLMNGVSIFGAGSLSYNPGTGSHIAGANGYIALSQ